MKAEINFSFQGLGIWIICALFYAYELLLRTVLGTFQIPIMKDLGLDSFGFALMSSTCYLLVYSSMQMPASMCAEKFGLKRILIFAVALCSFSAIGFANTHSLDMAIFVRMLMGLGSAFGFVCLLMAVYDWIPTKYYGLFIGLSQFIGITGPMFAAGPLNSIALNSSIDWRMVVFSVGLSGIALTSLIALFVKNNKNKTDKFRIIAKQLDFKKNLYQLLKQKQIWFIAIYSALIYFTIEYLAENEGKAFLQLNGYSSNFSSYMLTIGWLGCAIGSPVLGFLSDFIKRRKMILVFASMVCLASFCTILFFPISKLVLTISFFTLGFSSGGQSIGFAIMAEQCSKDYLAIGLGFNNALITLLIGINAPVIGYLLNFYSDAENLKLTDYHFAFSFIMILIFTAFIIATFFIEETYCRAKKEFTHIKSNGLTKNIDQKVTLPSGDY